jgi:hypothetical protein
LYVFHYFFPSLAVILTFSVCVFPFLCIYVHLSSSLRVCVHVCVCVCVCPDLFLGFLGCWCL